MILKFTQATICRGCGNLSRVSLPEAQINHAQALLFSIDCQECRKIGHGVVPAGDELSCVAEEEKEAALAVELAKVFRTKAGFCVKCLNRWDFSDYPEHPATAYAIKKSKKTAPKDSVLAMCPEHWADTRESNLSEGD